jgi:hypothetical protein
VLYLVKLKDMNKRFEKIILMCQDAYKRYGFEYEEKYSIKIKRFSDEIIKDKLIDKCKDKHFARQLCIKNCLTYEV